MTLMTRMARLLRADLHALIDRLELPDVLLRQAVREMEAICSQQQQHCERLQAQRQCAEQGLGTQQQTLTALQSQIDLCFTTQEDSNTKPESTDSLLRTCLRRRLEVQARMQQTIQSQARLQQEIEQQSRLLAEYQQRLETLQEQIQWLNLESEASATSPNAAAVDPVATSRITEADVELALMSELRSRGLR